MAYPRPCHQAMKKGAPPLERGLRWGWRYGVRMNEVIIHGKSDSDKRWQSDGKSADGIDGIDGVDLGLVVWLFVDSFSCFGWTGFLIFNILRGLVRYVR